MMTFSPHTQRPRGLSSGGSGVGSTIPRSICASGIRGWVLPFDDPLVIDLSLVATDSVTFGLNQICERRRPASEHHPGLICRIPHTRVIGAGALSHEPVVRDTEDGAAGFRRSREVNLRPGAGL
jgi:hypothetical protein